MITTDELKVQLAEHAKAVKDLESLTALACSANCTFSSSVVIIF